MLRKIRLYSSIASIYIITIGVIGAALCTPHALGEQDTASLPQATQTITHRTSTTQKTVSGQPIRIVIPDKGIDLPVDEGGYDAVSKTWTLSPTHAEFAVSTMPANDHGGTTFIYGHGTDAVFGKLGMNRPAIGSTAEIYTDNNHVFTYTLQSVQNLTPNDTSILRHISEGPPRLIVQTCTGAFSEWRSEFIYTLRKVQ